MRMNKNIVSVILLFIAVLMSYSNIFQNEFAWDDFYFIRDNIHIRDAKNIPTFFAEPSTGYLYRPLRSIFYTLNYNLWKLNILGYHLNSLLLHFAVTTLFYFITLKITEKFALSFITSLFFAVHPIHTERITNMTAAFDVYGILFLLLALFFYIKSSKENKKYAFFSITFYLLALFSSEEAITLIPLLILYDIFNDRINLQNVKLLLKKYIPFVIVTIAYLIIRFFIVQRIGRGEIYFEQSFFGTLLTTIKIFVQYMRILFFPIDLTIERVVRFEASILSIPFLFSLIVLILLFIFFIKSYNKREIMFFSIGWFFVTLLPFSNLVPQLTIMADRYLYLPSYGFCLLLALLILKIKDSKSIRVRNYSNAIIIGLVVLITSSYTFLTIQRNFEWRDNFTLLLKTAETTPLGTRVHHALALHYRDKGDYETAEKYALRAIELASKNYDAYENLGTIDAYKGNYGEAIKYYNKAIELNPDFYLAYNNLGLVYSYIGDFNSSIFYLKKAIEINPKLSKAYNDLGTIYGQIGNFDEAIKLINKAIEINPYDASYYKNLAVIDKFLGDRKTTKKEKR